MIVCICAVVSADDIRHAFNEGDRDVRSLKASLGICIECGACEPVVQSIVDSLTSEISEK